MQIVSIARPELEQALRAPERLREYCGKLEAGDILFFPETPISITSDALGFLLGHQQVGGAYHKNIAYRPLEDRITGFDAQNGPAAERLRGIMRRYSSDVVAFLREFLGPYQARWKVDYASYRPEEEQTRDLALRKRNDLLHTDAFPTRPTHGDRILRFFNNINPSRTRNWITTDTFDVLVNKMNEGKLDGGRVPLPSSLQPSSIKQTLAGLGFGRLAPSLKRSPYDEFMMRFHNYLKENSSFQENCPKQHWEFPPGSSWMVYTDMVSHAVLSGQFALEQTLIVSKDAMVRPEKSPYGVLSRMATAV
ncbi:MAG: Kdo hydroxylase family protein [Acidobacteria bacterium]|nr:Kdo hydroxylase family protein [Acidobacteriota bacterium]MBV9145463.1 Kdo hydroxylase family protein [Acidobacteriota bacterium]